MRTISIFRRAAYARFVSDWFSIEYLWCSVDLRRYSAARIGFRARAPGEWLDGYLFSLAGPIYAGTNEIQRNVVAERLLGLPRG